MMGRSACFFILYYLILFMHACKCNARPILNIHHEMLFPPPHEIQEKFEHGGNSKDSKLKEEDILHKKNEGRMDNSGGDEDWESWLHSAMNTTKLEGERVPLPQRKGRGKSSIFSDENLLVTDYEPPHRKSPIHN